MSEQTTEQLYATLTQMVESAETQLKACQDFANKHGLLFAFDMGTNDRHEYVPNVDFEDLKPDSDYIHDGLLDRKEYRSHFDQTYKWLRGNWMSSSTWC